MIADKLPRPILFVILVLTGLTLYQGLSQSAELAQAQRDRTTIIQNQNNSIKQTEALYKQLQGLGVQPVVNSNDIPKVVEGPPGDKGDQGVPGAVGPQGPQGPIGPQGPVGPQGKAGPYPECVLAATKCVGAQGPKGDTGVTGATGPAGPQGATGPAGKDGLDGKDGKDGVDGKDGADGAKGETGDKGPQGDPGPACPPGSSQVTKTVVTTEDPDGIKILVCELDNQG